MNARQKAKRFKRLYEESMARMIRPQIISEARLKHYKYAHRISMNLVVGVPEEILKSHIARTLTEGVKEVVERNMVVEKDMYNSGYVYSVELWVRE